MDRFLKKKCDEKDYDFAAFAAALALSASCNKEARYDAPEQPALRTVTFNALPTDTKTAFGDKSGNKYPVLWQEGDKVCPSFNFATVSSGNYITVTPSADGTSASFRGDFPDAESYRFMFVSPAATFKSINKNNGTIMVEFPSGQTSTAASPEPATTVFEKADNTSWAGAYYRLAYNVTNTTTSNKYVEFRGLEMWGYPAD